jgi:hypothetical protein
VAAEARLGSLRNDKLQMTDDKYLVRHTLADLSFVILSSVIADEHLAIPLERVSHSGEIPFHLRHSGIVVLAPARYHTGC